MNTDPNSKQHRARPSEQHPGRYLVIDWATGVVTHDDLTQSDAEHIAVIRNTPIETLRRSYQGS